HRLADDADEAVLALVASLDQLLDEGAHLAERVVDAGRVLAGELDHLAGVPDDVILTHGLEPECLDAERALADFGVPDKEAGGEGLAVDLGPAGGVDEKDKEVLFAGVEAGAAGHGLLRRLEVGSELLEHGQEVAVVEPGVSDAVDGADSFALR